MAILAVNAGSSSLKFSLHPLLGGRVRPSVLSGTIEGLEPGGQPEMAWTFAGQRQRKAVGGPGATPFLQALDCLRTLLAGLEGAPRIAAVAHRVVHGGEKYSGSVMITDDVIATLEECIPLAPLHNPANLTGMHAA